MQVGTVGETERLLLILEPLVDWLNVFAVPSVSLAHFFHCCPRRGLDTNNKILQRSYCDCCCPFLFCDLCGCGLFPACSFRPPRNRAGYIFLGKVPVGDSVPMGILFFNVLKIGGMRGRGGRGDIERGGWGGGGECTQRKRPRDHAAGLLVVCFLFVEKADEACPLCFVCCRCC